MRESINQLVRIYDIMHSDVESFIEAHPEYSRADIVGPYYSSYGSDYSFMSLVNFAIRQYNECVPIGRMVFSLSIPNLSDKHYNRLSKYGTQIIFEMRGLTLEPVLTSEDHEWRVILVNDKKRNQRDSIKVFTPTKPRLFRLS